MDKNNMDLLSNIFILGELFFFTVDGLKKNEEVIEKVLSDLYKHVTFN